MNPFVPEPKASKTHRGRRARKGPSAASQHFGIPDSSGLEPATVAPETNHHQDAKDHMGKAIEAKSPKVAFKHLMKAVKSMHKARG